MKCVECGGRVDNELIYADEVDQKMRELQLCFDCLFWTEYVEQKDSPHVVRVDGVHYVIGGGEDYPTHIRGFGGSEFTVAFFDGRKVKTANLWHQGEIPENFRDKLPNNAVFVRR